MKHKLYITEFENKIFQKPNDQKRMIKFGTTHHMDIMKRFDKNVDDGYVKNYDDWYIRPMYSQVYDSKAEARLAEQDLLHTRFPAHSHKVWVETYLGCATSDYYSSSTGITEIRLLTSSELFGIMDELRRTQDADQQTAKMVKRQQYLAHEVFL